LQIGPELYTNHPDKNSGRAIGSLAGEGGAAPAKSGEPATLPAGQAVGVDGMLTYGVGVTGVRAGKLPARGVDGG
jgi:hypothetical protein